MSLSNWLSTPVGRRCLANEQRLIRHALDCVFGEQLLQIGSWGVRDAFLKYARTQRKALLTFDQSEDTGDIVGDPARLGIASDSVDVVFLPHTLERTPSPHALLREVDRVLRADGHLIVLSFVPGSAWGLRHLLARKGYPFGARRMLRERRLRDWLELLSFEVDTSIGYCHTLPLERFRQLGTFPRERWAQRWLPMLAGGYLLCAQKRTRTLTPIRSAWKQRRLRVVGGLVEPTARASRTRADG
jgi:SAM-dependent methyltransferase